MPEDVRTHAFDDFFTTRAEAGGTGLGLTSVRHFVEQSDGMVALSSEVGRGTSVVIHLPQAMRSEPRGSLRPVRSGPSAAGVDTASPHELRARVTNT